MKETQTYIKPLANNNATGIFFQPKLAINQPNDIYEQEADSIADKVMRMQQPSTAKSFFTPPTIQRKCDHCEEEDKKAQRKENGNTNIDSSAQTENYLSSLSGGRNLSKGERNFFESRMGYDFSNVQLHTNNEANQSAKNINALAYTHGNNIVFGSNQYQPGTNEGRKLLAHELTHVIQQDKGVNGLIQKADIEHRTLTWSDFQGAVPPKNTFDAETFSDINYPDLTTIKPLIKEKETQEECTTGTPPQKVKKVEATVGMDSSGIKVSSFMSQEKSWVKTLFTSEDEMKKFCKTDANTLALISGCKDYFKTGKTNAATACTPLLDKCKEAVKKGTYSWKDIEAKDESGCNTIFEACKKQQTDALKYTTGRNKDVTSPDDCSTVLQDECLDSRKDAATDLLSHEQGHFDITDVIAKKLEADIKAIVDGTKKTVTGCGSAEAQKLANDVVEKEVKPKINDKVKEAQDKINEVKGYTDVDKNKIKGKLRTTQDSYDTETTHGSVTDKQTQWKDDIAKGNI